MAALRCLACLMPVQVTHNALPLNYLVKVLAGLISEGKNTVFTLNTHQSVKALWYFSHLSACAMPCI